MHESPRLRRLRNDFLALERLQSESSVFRFRASGKPAQSYHIEFRGRGLMRDKGKVKLAERHEVEIKLGASYPRTIPELRWLSPIYHPNISEIGMICLGGYGTHWVPSLSLEELCVMLWDMARYHNYDIRSPYNREAALWVANQTHYRFPIDPRPLRDLRAALGRIGSEDGQAASSPSSSTKPDGPPAVTPPSPSRNEKATPERVRKFLESLRAPRGPDQADDDLILLEPGPTETSSPGTEEAEEIVFIE